MNKKLFSTIKKPKLLLVEGQDEENFFEEFLKHLKIPDIQVIESKGKEQLKAMFPGIVNIPGISKLKALALIQDADKNAKDTFKSLCSTLKKQDLTSPTRIGDFTKDKPKIGIFTMPDGKSPGSLETLFLSTVKSEPITTCVNSFMECIQNSNSNKYNKPPKNKDKAQTRAFLSAMEEDTYSLGVAAKKSYWPFDSDKLKPLSQFLQTL